MKRALTLVVYATFMFSPSALAGVPNNLCVNGAVNSKLKTEVKGPSVDLRPAAIHQKPDQLDVQELEDLYGYIRALEGGWETPHETWSKNATIINVSKYGESVCQIVYQQKSLYVAIVDNAGFLYRALSNLEFKYLDEIVPVEIYDFAEPAPPAVEFRPPDIEE